MKIKNSTDLNEEKIKEILGEFVPMNEVTEMTINRENRNYVTIRISTKDGFEFVDFINNDYELI